jgi:quercetin dioxygenase-like cupin family protein
LRVESKRAATIFGRWKQKIGTEISGKGMHRLVYRHCGRRGDIIWFAPNEKHWHGITPTTAMTHIGIQETVDGKPVGWMEKVTDEQYH